MSKSNGAPTVEIVATRAALLTMLTGAARVATNGKPIPILASAWIHASGGRVTWWATDTHLWRGGVMAATVVTPGAGLVPVAQLLGMLKHCPDGDVSIAVHEKDLKVRAGAFKASVPLLPIEDFPLRPEVPEGGVDVPSAVLGRVIRMTSMAIHETETRYFMRGALLQVTPGRLSCAATDGHRLARAVLSHAHKVKGDAPAAILPKRALDELVALVADCDDAELVRYVQAERGHFFQVGTSTIVCRPVEGQFPDIDRMIPKAFTSEMSIDRELLLRAVGRVGLSADEQNKGICLSAADDVASLSTQSVERGVASEEMKCDAETSVPEFRVNKRYLSEALGAMTTEQVECKLANGRMAVFVPVKDPDVEYVHIIMTMRL